MRRNVAVPDSFPSMTVFSLGVFVAVIFFVVTVIFLFVFFAEPAVREIRTAGIRTRLFRFSWQSAPPVGTKKAPRGFLPLELSFYIFPDYILPRQGTWHVVAKCCKTCIIPAQSDILAS